MRSAVFARGASKAHAQIAANWRTLGRRDKSSRSARPHGRH